MNMLELLPKSIDYKGSTFFLQVTVTAWGNLCVSYKECNKDKKILSYVVEKDKEAYIPTGFNEDIGNCPTLDLCLTAMIRKINELVEKGVLQAEYH